MARLPVVKCHGTGNDFVLLDNVENGPFSYSDLAKTLCDRRFGVGADGLLVLLPPTQSGVDIEMRIFNADGSEAEMCGNGVRCVARYCFEQRPNAPRRLAIKTIAGVVTADVVETGARFDVRVAMGAPESIYVYEDPSQIGQLSASLTDIVLGNPHSVAFIDADLDTVDLAAFSGEVSESGPFTEGVNVEIARPAGGAIAIRVFERGVGETLACGTGACAVAIAAIMTERAKSPVSIAMRGGVVQIAWDGPDTPVYLTGEAVIVFRAEVEIPDMLAATAGAIGA